MSGTFPLDIPAISERVESQFLTFVDRSQSGFRNARANNSHIWKFRIVTPVMQRVRYQKLFAFFQKQKGRYDTFTITSKLFRTPLGTISGTPLVNGSHAAGAETIAIDGWSALETVLKAGDFIKFANHSKVYMVTEDALSNGSGETSLSILPALVSSLANNEGVTVQDVPFTVAFSKDAMVVEGDENNYASFDIELEEVFN